MKLDPTFIYQELWQESWQSRDADSIDDRRTLSEAAKSGSGKCGIFLFSAYYDRSASTAFTRAARAAGIALAIAAAAGMITAEQ